MLESSMSISELVEKHTSMVFQQWEIGSWVVLTSFSFTNEPYRRVADYIIFLKKIKIIHYIKCYMLLGHKALHSVAVMSKLKRALLYEMDIALVLLQ